MKLAGEQLVLDTNILVHLLRGRKAAEVIEHDYRVSGRSPRAIISVVTKGELMALAYKLAWGADRRERIDAMLTGMPALDISSAPIFDAYAELDHSSARRGITMGKNDLWIAATTRVLGGVLLTTDGDFAHLDAAGVRVERILDAQLR